MNNVVFGVSDFVAVFNQTLEFAYASVTIVGELANFRISKGRWVYFDLKDDYSSVKFFGTTQQLPGPLEDGMLVQVSGAPRLHNLYGFSVNVQFMAPIGEGSLKKAANLLQTKLAKEGLFDQDRKRQIPSFPRTIGLITSGESAAFHDFSKILNARWCGVELHLADVQVQGDPAPMQIVRAVEYFNVHHHADVLVIIRGGGSADDLAAFNSEQVTRAVAGSRTPTVLAIGHEVDISLAELAADMRASTPSNAAELLVPDKAQIALGLRDLQNTLQLEISNNISQTKKQIELTKKEINQTLLDSVHFLRQYLLATYELIEAYNPMSILKRGFAVVRLSGSVVSSVQNVKPGQLVEVQLASGQFESQVIKVKKSHHDKT